MYKRQRYGETAALTIHEIDLENGTVTINGTYDRALKIKTTPKTEFSYRTITISENIKNIIQAVSYTHLDVYKRQCLVTA